MEINKGMKTVKVKGGKDYVEVKERINALADSDTNYSIETNYQYFPDRKMWVVHAKLTWEGSVYTGLAQEIESDNFKQVNFTSALENAETSAVGRACAFAGIGIVESIASADEVNKAVNRGSNFNKKEEDNRPWLNDKELIGKLKKAVIDGKVDSVKKRLETYKVSKATREEILQID